MKLTLKSLVSTSYRFLGVLELERYEIRAWTVDMLLYLQRTFILPNLLTYPSAGFSTASKCGNCYGTPRHVFTQTFQNRRSVTGSGVPILVAILYPGSESRYGIQYRFQILEVLLAPSPTLSQLHFHTRACIHQRSYREEEKDAEQD